jgi:nucleotide-binding universal stress UspA family protein
MYRLVMIWITDGSGGSGLSEEEFGSWAVKLNASITFVEYTLTFLVSMAALVTFVADRFPVLNEPFLGLQYRTVVAIALSILTGWLVNRGPKIAARAFGPATAGVLLLMWAMVLATIFKLGFHLPKLDLQAFRPGNLRFTLAGYVRILAVMTGIEIFANLVAAYEGEPRKKSRLAFQSLLIIMGTTCITMLIVGPAIAQLADPLNTEVSVFTQTMDQLLPGPLAWLGTIVGVLVLLSASAASAQGLQNLALGLKLRHYIPAFVGQRNTYEVAAIPVWIEVGIVSLCFLAFGTNEETYLAIYAAGVFILLSMTGWAATKRLLRQFQDTSSSHNILSLVGTVVAAMLTTVATVIIFVERFAEGAWTYFIFLPILYLVFSYFRRKLGDPSPVEERRGLLFAEKRYLTAFEPSSVSLARILVPLDGSEFAEQALPTAQVITESLSGRLTLLSVIQSSGAPRTLPMMHSNLDGDLWEHEEYLRKIAAKFEGTGIKTESTVAVGSVAGEILSATYRQHIDLLVMSTHGRSGVGRMLVGSVANEVLRQGQVPILLVRPGAGASYAQPHFRRLLVTLDGSAAAEQVLPYSHALALNFDSEVILLSVTDDQEAESRLPNLKQYLDNVANSFHEAGINTRAIVTGYRPAVTIVNIASSEAADLVMMATRGRGGRERLFYGSVADRVVKQSQIPILLVPVRL